MLGEVNLAHSTRAEHPLNHVAGEGLTVVQRHAREPTNRHGYGANSGDEATISGGAVTRAELTDSAPGHIGCCPYRKCRKARATRPGKRSPRMSAIAPGARSNIVTSVRGNCDAVSIRTPFSILPPRSPSTPAKALVIDCEPPAATGQPKRCPAAMMPISSSAYRTVTCTPAFARATAAASPFGPLPTTSAVVTPAPRTDHQLPGGST